MEETEEDLVSPKLRLKSLFKVFRGIFPRVDFIFLNVSVLFFCLLSSVPIEKRNLGIRFFCWLTMLNDTDADINKLKSTQSTMINDVRLSFSSNIK
jgi:hypothetical protein